MDVVDDHVDIEDEELNNLYLLMFQLHGFVSSYFAINDRFYLHLKFLFYKLNENIKFKCIIYQNNPFQNPE